MGNYREQVAEMYAATFAARTDVYSAWNGTGWRPVRQPLTGPVVVAALTGAGPSVSGYLIAPGSTSHVGALDFDTDDGYRQALALGSRMWAAGVPAYVEPSRRGAHLWTVIDRSLPASVIRRAFRALLAATPLPTDDPHIELRPGSDAITDDGLGHALRLPLMPHPKTGARGRMLDPRDETPIGERVSDIVLGVIPADGGVIEAWAARWSPPVTRHDIPPEMRKPRDRSHDDEWEGIGASDILRTRWGVPNAVAGRSVRCPAHEDKVASLSILRDDRRVICKAGHCVLNNDDHGRGTYELDKLAAARG